MGFAGKNVIVIGGGLAGLTAAILLNRFGYEVTVIEKKQFPFHRVCGEYVSNEVIPFLTSLDIDVDVLQPSRISKLAVSAVSGKLLTSALDLGGFGISRYAFDNFLYQKAKAAGVTFILGDKVNDIRFTENEFKLILSDNSTLTAPLVIGAYGKRSNLDQKLNREFFYHRSPYLGVKYHIKTDFPDDVIQLDNFEGGYCGICKIEEGSYSLCYLSETKNLKKYGSIPEMEEKTLFKNAYLKRHLTQSEFLWGKPEVINEITFERKTLVKDHILFCGDAAGMITPLCGNGMAMAIHSGKILAEAIRDHFKPGASTFDRQLLEKSYQHKWENQFALRLKTGRFIQHFFGSNKLFNLAVTSLKTFPLLTKTLVKNTHGKPF